RVTADVNSRPSETVHGNATRPERAWPRPPMRSEPILDAFAKTEWAETAIHDLNQSIKAFFQANPYEIRSDLNEDGSERIWRFALTRKLPRSLSVSAGAILHALRTPLDQMVSVVADAAGKDQTGVSFVVGDTREKFEA